MLEQLPDLPRLPRQLLLVGKVLVLAAAAGPEQRATRRHPVRRGLQNRHQIALRVVFIIPENPRQHRFPRQRVGHENHPAIHPAHTRPEIRQRIDLQFDLLMILERRGDKLLRRSLMHGILPQ